MSDSKPSTGTVADQADCTGTLSMITSTGEITRSEKFWFEDGNIIIQAEKTYFCVHRGLLSFKSSVFRDTFAMPQEEESATVAAVECVDGRPVMHLSETVKEITYFLETLYMHYLELRKRSEDEVETAMRLIALLRFSNKYNVPYLRELVEHELEEFLSPNPHRILDSSFYYVPTLAFDAEMTNAFDEASLLKFQIFILYKYCCVNLVEGPGSFFISRLSQRLRTRVVTGHLAVQSAVRKYAINIIDLQGHLAQRPPHARCLARAKELNALLASAPIIDLEHPFQPFLCESVFHRGDRILDDGFCAECSGLIEHRRYEELRILWDALPELLGFGNWDEILAADTEYLRRMSQRE